MSKKKTVVVSITPFEVWAQRFNYIPPPVPEKGPNPECDGAELTGTHPYFGPSKSTRASRRARHRGAGVSFTSKWVDPNV